LDDNCIFCRIANGELGTEFVAQTENAVAFDDIEPVTPVHVLVVPKRHVSALRDLENPLLAAELLDLARQVAEEKGLFECVTGWSPTMAGSRADRLSFALACDGRQEARQMA